jgi:hypothetical protein
VIQGQEYFHQAIIKRNHQFFLRLKAKKIIQLKDNLTTIGLTHTVQIRCKQIISSLSKYA